MAFINRLQFFLLILLLPSLCFGIESANKLQPCKIRLAISVFSIPALNEPIIPATIDALKKIFGSRLEVKHFNLEELADVVKNGETDLVLSSAGFYRRTELGVLRALTTAIHPLTPNPNKSEGSTFFVRADRKDINSFEDMKGKILVSNVPSGFSGYQIAMGEIAKRGYNHENFFREKRFTGYEMLNVVDSVKKGHADIGVLRSCYLESLGQENTKNFKVIEPKEGNELLCLYSTSLYPNWTISISSTAPQEIAGEVVHTLLNMPETKEGLKWGIATDFSQVDQLFKTLKIGPFSYLRDWTLKRFLSDYWQWIVLTILLILGLVFYSALIRRQVALRTGELRQALANQQKAELLSSEANKKLEALKRSSSIGQLCSIFVHEVRQPLSSIKCYVRSLHRILENSSPNKELAAVALDKLEDEVSRIDYIMENVRDYAKRNPKPMVPTSLGQVVIDSVEELKAAKKIPQPMILDIESNSLILADPFQIALVVINLIQNASEAQNSDSPIRISVKTTSDKEICLEVRDNGPRLSDTGFANLHVSMSSSKEDGLGLGLAIIRSIVERHKGRITFEQLEPQGLSVKIYFPTKNE